MSLHDLADLIRALGLFEPSWALALLVGGILSVRSPQLIRATFSGVRTVIVAVRTPVKKGRH
jgi:hypothetical protein